MQKVVFIFAYLLIAGYFSQSDASKFALKIHPTPFSLGSEEGDLSGLIWFYKESPRNNNNYTNWVSKLDHFLEEYRSPAASAAEQPPARPERQICDFDTPPGPGRVCDVEVRDWNPCVPESGYGFPQGTPCIFLALQASADWEPLPYNETSHLPSSMPYSLSTHITSRPVNELNSVWVNCEGTNPADMENIGPLEFIPRRGFPAFYFPHQDRAGYLTPLLAVWFKGPMEGVVIQITCRAWARNIPHELGAVTFELLIDS